MEALLKNWYESGSAQVIKLDSSLSESFKIDRDVKQGTSIVPTHDRSTAQGIRGLRRRSLHEGVLRWGFSVCKRCETLATSEDSLRKLIDMVKSFADRNLLKLNVSKCEIL